MTNIRRSLSRLLTYLPRPRRCLQCNKWYVAWGNRVWTDKLCSPACRKAWLPF